MKLQDKFFVPVFVTAALMVCGLMSENIRFMQSSQISRPPVDVKEVKKKIVDAQLTPYEAKFWVVN